MNTTITYIDLPPHPSSFLCNTKFPRDVLPASFINGIIYKVILIKILSGLYYDIQQFKNVLTCAIYAVHTAIHHNTLLTICYDDGHLFTYRRALFVIIQGVRTVMLRANTPSPIFRGRPPHIHYSSAPNSSNVTAALLHTSQLSEVECLCRNNEHTYCIL